MLAGFAAPAVAAVREPAASPYVIEVAGQRYGPDTCKSGYVWREAFEGDSVCVTPDRRTQANADNAAGLLRRGSAQQVGIHTVVLNVDRLLPRWSARSYDCHLEAGSGNLSGSLSAGPNTSWMVEAPAGRKLWRSPCTSTKDPSMRSP
jgi:hypothetical protein